MENPVAIFFLEARERKNRGESKSSWFPWPDGHFTSIPDAIKARDERMDSIVDKSRYEFRIVTYTRAPGYIY